MARILLVDDDPVSRRYLREVLAPAGHTLVEAADGGVALQHARSSRFDWVISDLRLPVFDGEAWLTALRADPDAPSRGSAVLLCTAELGIGQRERLQRAGFEVVLEKPVAAETLLALVRERAAPAHGVREDHALMTHDARNDGAPAPVLDDEAGLAASGTPDVLHGLRELFLAELPGQLRDLDAAVARGDAGAVREIVHRLRAACRFCGALALDGCLDTLHRDASTVAATRDAWPAARACAAETLAVLRARLRKD